MTLPPTLPPLRTCSVAVIGLGYVGLPLAVEFATKRMCLRTKQVMSRLVIGFDIDSKRIEALVAGRDHTKEVSLERLGQAVDLHFTSDPEKLAAADVFIVAVPTPIDPSHRPDLTALKKATVTVGHALKTRKERNDASVPVVIFESTVYPGATEEICVPLLEANSGLDFNSDFYCGYSPERVNPGDQNHRFASIVKVTSGSTDLAAQWIDDFYGSVVDAGTYAAGKIVIAEAAKVIENTQRDLNIALVNELAIIFRLIGIDVLDVLDAAGTKWNFLPFKPGLVGGHCIGVDPYYLTYKAELLGYHPQVVLAGRRINDDHANWVVEQLVIEMARAHLPIGGAKVLVLGITFKENCPDLRNSKVFNVLSALQRYAVDVSVVDPWADFSEVQESHNLSVLPDLPEGIGLFDAILVAVRHQQFIEFDTSVWKRLVGESGLLLDLKGVIPRELNPIRL